MLFRLGKGFGIGKVLDWKVDSKMLDFYFQKNVISSHHNLVKDQMQISFVDKILPYFEALV